MFSDILKITLENHGKYLNTGLAIAGKLVR